MGWGSRGQAKGRQGLRLWACLLLLTSCGFAAAPSVKRIEPPNWWAGLPDPMLLLYGEHLGDAVVTADAPGVRVSRVEPGGETHLFVWLHVDPDAPPGEVSLRVRNREGAAHVPFRLQARRAASDGAQGVTSDDVIYLIMPDRFADGDPSNNLPPESPGTYDRGQPRAYHGGDLRGIRAHLPYLHELGVTAIWLTPIVDNDNRSPNDYHGYGAVDFYKVDEHFGTLAELEELVAEAHRQRIKVILDYVVNHTGPRHPWVADPPDSAWLHGTAGEHLTARSPFRGLTDPHSVPRQWRDMVEGWFAGILPDVNQDDPRVAEYFFVNAVWWAESTGIDGYRLDTFPYVSRRFWADWPRRLRQVYPQFATVGEVFDRDSTITSFFAGGREQFDGIDSGVSTLFDFPLYYALREVLTQGQPASRLAEVLRQDSLYPDGDRLVTFFSNHDVRRLASAAGGDLSALKLAYALVLTMRGTPQLYYGDEIGLQGGDDPDNRRDFPGGFPGDPRDAFSKAGRTPAEQDLFAYVQALLRLRQQHPALCHGRHYHLLIEPEVYAFVRQAEADRVLAVFNSAKQPREVRIPLTDTPLAGVRALQPLLGSPAATVEDDSVVLRVPARSLVLYQVD